MRRTLIAFAALLWAGVSAAADKPLVGPAPDWVRPIAAPLGGSVGDAPTAQLLVDIEDRFDKDSNETYWERIQKIGTPQGLAEAGNISLEWNPSDETLTINKLRIRRGEQVIDIQAKQPDLIVMRREDRLERAMLDGTLTAAILPEGLQVGDIVEVAATWTHRDPVLRGRVQRIIPLPSEHTTLFRVREIWTGDRPMHWRATSGFPEPVLTKSGDMSELVVTQHDAQAPKAPKDAPDRFAEAGKLEMSAFDAWPEISALMAPLYRTASTLAPESPLEAEAAIIRDASPDPLVRTAAALRLVQDKIRYVFLGMDAGGYKPVDADTTWNRRFGDCKGKTVVLLALLQQLGIEAIPALVDTERGDGLETRLPMAGAFDHVIVRATIGGKEYWLDGTRTGVTTLNALPIPDMRWALPLTSPGSGLESLRVPPLEQPDALTELHIDASHGIDLPASVHGVLRLRGDQALRRRSKLAYMSVAEAEEYLRDQWRKDVDWLSIDSVSAEYDASRGEERLFVSGTAKMSWKTSRGAREWELDGSGLGWKEDFERKPGPFQDAPFAVPHPYFDQTVETIVLPRGGKGFSIDGADIDRTVAGRQFRRSTRIENGVVTMIAGVRSIATEFPAAEASRARAALLDLRDDVATVGAPARYRATDEEMAALTSRTPDSAGEFVSRGDHFYERAEYDKAIADFDRAIALKPDYAAAYADRGNANLYAGRMELGAADYETALRLDPRNAVAIRGRGIVFERQGDTRQAIASFDRALDIDPSDAFALEHHARALRAERQLEPALADYERLIALQPARTRELRLTRAALLLELQDGERLLAEADKLAVLAAAEPADRFRRAALVLLNGRQGSGTADLAAARSNETERTGVSTVSGMNP